MFVVNKKIPRTFLFVILVNSVYSYQLETTSEGNNTPNGEYNMTIQGQLLQDIKKTNESNTENGFLEQYKELYTDDVGRSQLESDREKLKYFSTYYTPSPEELTTENLENQYSVSIDSSENEIYDNNTLQVNQCGVHPARPKIIGGDEVNIDEHPWLALLDYQKGRTGLCGGSLITSSLVITAAHCIVTEYGKPIQVRLAEYDTSSYPTDTVIGPDGVAESVNVTIIKIEWSKVHPDYKYHTKGDDIGLVKLSESVKFSDFIKPICLPDVNIVDKFTTNTILITAGWGEDEDNESSKVKKEVRLPYKPLNDCKHREPKDKTNEKYICAGGEKNKDSCRGDSGGPLMFRDGMRYVLVGIVKSGYYLCGNGTPSVYTNVYGYLDWIKSFI